MSAFPRCGFVPCGLILDSATPGQKLLDGDIFDNFRADELYQGIETFLVPLQRNRREP